MGQNFAALDSAHKSVLTLGIVRSSFIGFEGTFDSSNDGCKAFSMFWIPNINTYLDNNYAVGSRICYWILPHNTWFGFETSGTRVRLGFIQKNIRYTE